LKVDACHLGGVLPRSEALIAAYRRLAEGRETYEAVKELARHETEGLLKLQKSLGMTYVVEGQLLWHDIFRPFSELLSGVKIGPLTRWFDNNLFYKKPIIVSNISRTTTILDKYLFTELVRGLNWKLILPDPYTFYTLSLNQAYRQWEDLVLDIAGVIADELRDLSDAQPALVQLSAPCYSSGRPKPDHVETMKEAFRKIKNSVDGETMIHLHFTDASNAIPWILDFPADIIGIDPYATNLDGLKGYSFRGSVAIGCLDARNSYVESVDDVKEVFEMVAESLGARSYHLTTSTDLEYLPKSVAEKKMRRLSEAYSALGGS